MKIADKIKQLQALAPNHSKYGQLYNKKSETQGAFNRIRLYTLFVSDDGDLLFRPHVFHKRSKLKTPQEWHAWLSEHLTGIIEKGVLPGITIRTGGTKQWAVKQIFGWVADVVPITKPAAVRKRGHKTTKKGRKNG